ncbi:TIGR03087 family PEP-CTERM/XrtA system glycosyltransferase [Roseateles oligotrophus]|uniref:TIGR03087 family PEP-CTERM/XrtA system glycosyltransferase n=1 Tax=Roseateles oligotrophus TaxID=1769250 RepID=A0ABT2YFA4_9BURK|nr:TIGR03087 family PEP-CTERM/XrtA system glycosyltransferase [Roseateles oligotrophus]MCV2368735.1 TIGR03087 family PEP-CTERM/XrtA system glycosyltransferase [Roseateles oligotrophus]
MKILYICHRFPFPPKRGGKIRPFNMIRHLSAAGHKITVCSLVRADDEGVEGEGIAPYCEAFHMARVHNPVQALRMVARLPLRTPSSMGFFYSPELRRKIDGLLVSERYDLIFVHCSSVAQYVEHVDHIPKILDFGDMDSQKWLEYADAKPFPLSLGYRLEGYKMLAAEKRLARRFDLCTATTRAEWETLNSYGTGARTDWFPNGVDADYFSPDGSAYDPDTISFIGRMDYYPNQECMARFCVETWPLIKARRPQMKLTIVGADPSLAMRKLGEIDGVTVTGSVPHVQPYVRGSALMVAPLAIARGTQNKILEAMAMGVPVVTSSIAAGGVDAEAEAHLLVADTPQQCADAVLRIVENPAERERLSAAGRARMLSHHAWPRSMERLDKIIAQVRDNVSSKKQVGIV